MCHNLTAIVNITVSDQHKASTDYVLILLFRCNETLADEDLDSDLDLISDLKQISSPIQSFT